MFLGATVVVVSAVVAGTTAYAVSGTTTTVVEQENETPLITRLASFIPGDSKGYERRYIARVMLAADTHLSESERILSQRYP